MLRAFRDSLNERARMQREREDDEQRMRVTRESAELGRETIVREHARVVTELTLAIERLAKSDLTHSVTSPFPPQFEPLRGDLNAALETLRRTLATIDDAAQSMRTGAMQMELAIGQLQNRTLQQSSNLNATSASLDRLTGAVKSSADGAAHVEKIVLAADDNARKALRSLPRRCARWTASPNSRGGLPRSSA